MKKQRISNSNSRFDMYKFNFTTISSNSLIYESPK